MHVTIRPLDPASDSDLVQYEALDRAVDEHAYGGSETCTLAQRRAALADTPYHRAERWVAVAEPMDGGQMIVGSASMHLSLQDNLDTVAVSCGVHPAHRGHGIATALLEEALLPALRTCGRHLVEAWGEIPPEGDPDDPALAPIRLARRLGISRRNVAVCRTLELPIEQALLERLQAEVDEKIGAYRIELWDDGVPEEHLGAYGVLLRQIELDDPLEELEHEAPDYPPERVRTEQQRLRDTGVRQILAVAVAPDGTFVGNSEINIQQSPDSTLAWQEATLVMPEHRGHRLGLALKVATHRLLRERAPQVRALATFNSHVNPWMIDINDKLGYQVRSHEVALQGRPDLAELSSSAPAHATMIP